MFCYICFHRSQWLLTVVMVLIGVYGGVGDSLVVVVLAVTGVAGVGGGDDVG